MSGKIAKKPLVWSPYADLKGKIDKEDDDEEEDEEQEVPDDKDYILVSCPKCGNTFHKCIRD